MSASDASWAEFWKTSSVSTPTPPALEWCWYGSLYWTKGFASTDPSVPPSGLYGLWVSSDKPAWNGDFTLDYNQESQFEHVFASGHPELAASCWGSILEYSNYTAGTTNGVGSHLAETMASAAKLNGSCPDGCGILFPCHIALGAISRPISPAIIFSMVLVCTRRQYLPVQPHPPHSSRPDTQHQTLGAADLTQNDYEYTLNKTFATSATYFLIDGFTRFWHCRLHLGADGYLHDTASATQSGEDSPFEGGNTNDPVTSLALIKRLATFQLRLAEELGLTAPAYVSEMVVKLAPFATARKRNKDGQLVQVNSPTLNISKNGCSGSESCDPFFL